MTLQSPSHSSTIIPSLLVLIQPLSPLLIIPYPNSIHTAVRGPVVIKADELSTELSSSSSSLPFSKVVYTNIGNPHSVGQKALTWPRQVLALVDLPPEAGVDHPDVLKMFPEDAVERAREIKAALGGGGTGAYSHSKGCLAFRKDVQAFIEKRDGLPCNPDDLYLTSGASAGIGQILTTIISKPTDGVMIPIPQYPIYSASLALLGGTQVGYSLDESAGWSASLETMQKSLDDAKAKGITVRALVVINPGNPTGQVLSPEAVQDVCKFCADNDLVLMADEVYQANVYAEGKEFTSCKKAAHLAGVLDRIELVSFHSTSKGIYGECGRRGGYMELIGFDGVVKDQIYKLASSTLCSNLPGQVMTSLMVRGPPDGGVSKGAHEDEIESIFGGLKKRAKLVVDGLNEIDGFECQEAEGAMYCFPKVTMPPKAIEDAKSQGMTVDGLYALSLLDRTGICVVPASGFGQEDGRAGFRTTFLPEEKDMKEAVDMIKVHHEEFVKRYA